MAAKKKTSKKTKKKSATRRARHPQGLKEPLLFVDTNILLGFYRAQNDLELALLERLESAQTSIITTYQVEMEFKKNRQKVILDALGEIPKSVDVSLPAFLTNTQSEKSIRKLRKDINRRLAKEREKIRLIMHEPTLRDPVYKTSQRLFKARTPLNLNRCNAKLYKERRNEIRELANKRFSLGYPPRKDSDTSVGDAVNWEWVISCCKPEKRDVVIVSRDSDYGVQYGKEWYINDWLLAEFRSRVNPQGKVLLTGKLAAALKWINVRVPEKEIEAEEDLVQNSALIPRIDYVPNFSKILGHPAMNLLREQERRRSTLYDLINDITRVSNFSSIQEEIMKSPTERLRDILKGPLPSD